MILFRRICLACALLLTLSNCAGDQNQPNLCGDDVPCSADSTHDGMDAGGTLDGAITDGTQKETLDWHRLPEDADTGGPDWPVPEEGTFGWPCQGHDDCQSYLCIDTIAGAVCTIPCVEECPEAGWLCKEISVGGPDELYACIPPETALCRPCASDDSCKIAAGETARCVPYGDAGWFCGTDCAGGKNTCPQGFQCQDVELDGQATKQCLALEGDCPCLFGFVGLDTECYKTTEAGSCEGLRTCTKIEAGFAWSACDAPEAEPESCNGKDDDCNGLVDDGLGEAVCGAGLCQHVVAGCVDAVPGICDPFAGAVAEKCNGLDDDCDGDVDDAWPDKGGPCDGPDLDLCPGGILSCSEDGEQLACTLDDENFAEVCNGVDDDCDGQVDEAEDLGETTCGLGICEHTVSACVDGAEAECDPLEGAEDDDAPDSAYEDSDCDGVDGTAALAVFADVQSGNDGNPGTMEEPVKSIDAALDRAELEGKKYVLVSHGVYPETVTVRDGVGIYGQYDGASGWTRAAKNTTQIQGGAKGLIAQGVEQVTEVAGFLITSASASAAGESSYGVFSTASPGLHLIGNVIQAGSGAAGAPGAAGQLGLNGSDGSNGGPGCRYGCHSEKLGCFGCLGLAICGACTQPLGGGGGASPCGAGGGTGGGGGQSDSTGESGVSGQGAGAGDGGPGGGKSADGTTGEAGQGGAHGGDGPGGADTGDLSADGYIAADGDAGVPGINGGGGGGGGAGGGETYAWPACCKTYGSSGGGGGGGGCHGGGGIGGGGGGGSFAVYVAAAGVTVIDCVLKTGSGGPGGTGGLGGGSGDGGLGGDPGPKGDDDNQGLGAAGGKGGDGGAGGNGGGGGGGPVAGIACGPSAAVQVQGVTYQLGSPGPGGNSSGYKGTLGTKEETIGCQ